MGCQIAHMGFEYYEIVPSRWDEGLLNFGQTFGRDHDTRATGTDTGLGVGIQNRKRIIKMRSALDV